MTRGFAGVLACAAVALPTGCGTGDDRRQVRRAVQAFHDAATSGRGAAACAHLTPAAASALERQAHRPCAEAVGELRLSGGRVRRVQVFETSAVAALAGGDVAYLDRADESWRVSAAGCRPTGVEPADCELED